jgi:hypothetical protein
MSALKFCRLRRFWAAFQTCCLWPALAACFFPACAAAQQEPVFRVLGYIKAISSPGAFDVNGRHVATSSETTYRWMDETASDGHEAQQQIVLQVGMYVGVTGTSDSRMKTIGAAAVYIRNDDGRKFSGLGVIDRVLSAGTPPLFRADGYRVRIIQATNVSIAGDLKSLADVGAGTWMHYQGKLDGTGILVASKVKFFPAKPAKFIAIGGLEVRNVWVDGPDPTPTQKPPGKTRFSDKAGAHYKPIDDPALQERVQRIGMKLVPRYQRALPLNDPSRIDFRFFAIDEPKARWEICSSDGLVLLPRQVVERLKSDDELAAVLADGVAMNLQLKTARMVTANRVLFGAEIAAEIASIAVPGLGLSAALALGSSENKMIKAMEEQRSRVALSLLSDAGYDLAEAANAWRLLAPKHLPANLNSIEYPERSGYMLSIIYS